MFIGYLFESKVSGVRVFVKEFYPDGGKWVVKYFMQGYPDSEWVRDYDWFMSHYDVVPA